jgi:hypothetical protein
VRLYEITQSIESLFNESVDLETGELIGDINFEALGELKEQRKDKLLNCGKYYKKLEFEYKAIKETEQKFKDKAQASKRRMESLKNYILSNLEKDEKINDVELSVSYRKPSQIVVVTDIDRLPRLYKKVEISADKAAIKKALKSGAIEGASLEFGAAGLTIK